MQVLGKWVLGTLSELGAIVLFAYDSFRVASTRKINYSHIISQVYVAGVRSLLTTVMVGIFVGAIMAIQINLQLIDFGAQGFLGGLATSTTIRNVGPVLIAFMLSGKVGAYTSAELGTMRVTEQIDAIRCLGADPIECLVVPRMLAVIVSSFILLIIGLMFSIGGGMFISSFALGVNAKHFLYNIPNIVTYWSIATGVLKSLVYGFIIAVICCYRGYYTTGGAVGVGQSVKKTAVQSLVCIIVCDFFISSFSGFLHELLRLDYL